MFGNPGQSFECGHEHGEGDRCVAFWYAGEYFEQLVAGAGRSHGNQFNVARLPPVRSLAASIARVGAGVIDPRGVSWEELGIRLATGALSATAGMAFDANRLTPSAEARVTRTVRMIDRHPNAALTVGQLARESGLSPYHFLRTFERVTGLTPHQYVRRTRLREAAMRLGVESGKVLDIALDSGFGDVSNFNRAFRSEFGMGPTVYRRSS
jgi:AraC-like DNA-binding protein